MITELSKNEKVNYNRYLAMQEFEHARGVEPTRTRSQLFYKIKKFSEPPAFSRKIHRNTLTLYQVLNFSKEISVKLFYFSDVIGVQQKRRRKTTRRQTK